MTKKGLSRAQLCMLFCAFQVVLLIYAVFFLHPYYASNDEFTLSAIASGAYGGDTWYFIYIHSAFGWILKAFYALLPNVNCYTLVMYALIFLSVTAIGFTWIRKNGRVGTILAFMLALASLSPLYVEFQYTKTAAIVTAAGYVLIFGAEKKRHTLTGIVFLLLGSWIRFEAFGMVSIVAFGLWLARAFRFFVKKEYDWKRFLLRDCMPFFAAFALVFGSIALENVIVYTPGSVAAHYKEYDTARQQLLDYGVPEWEEYQEEYEALGLTRTDVLNLENWLIADSDRYTAEVFRAIIAFRQERPFQWEYLLDYLIILAKKPLFILSALLLLLWLFPPRTLRERKNRIAVLWPFVALLGIYLYFIKIYRVLPIVVTACLLGVLVFSWTAAGEELAERFPEQLTGRRFVRAGLIGAALTCVICVRMLVTPAFRTAVQQSEESLAYRELYDTITEDKDIYYVFDPITNNGVELGYSIFEKLPEGYLTNVFTLGGWETESPQVSENLAQYEQWNLMKSLYLSDRSVLISENLLEHLLIHIDDTYDGLFLTYSKVGEIGDFDLYTLNYTMQNLEETEEYTASIDTTYTAENERYDVFEATVNMSPEELEGKSVFLWMESVESGKVRMYQGVWQQQDENGLCSLLYDTELADTDQVKFTIPKMSYPLDDRYKVHIVIREDTDGTKIATENHLYE
ncbi:MAG: hypothetical protein LIO67_02490 [Lachnospiraceae bacterium]|nr:hypothetical protein [Lachnospiraceae bacterium]